VQETDQGTLQVMRELRLKRLPRIANENNLVLAPVAPAPNNGSPDQQCCAE